MKAIAILFVLFIHTQSFAQDSLSLRKYLKPINSTDILSSSLRDLEAIGKAIGDAQIVVLGEQDHGDADAIEMKARLVRYLHEKKGFQVLAFESDLFSITDLENHKKESWYIDSLQRSVSAYWGRTHASQPLWKYIRSAQTDKAPLEITGFDMGLRTDHAKNNFINAFNAAAQKAGLESEAAAATMQKLLNNQPAADFTDREKKSFEAFIQKGISAVKVNDRSYIIFMAAKNRALNAWTRNARELAMTNNLTWLLDHKYKGRKIIVWTASFHAVKNIYEVVANSERKQLLEQAVNKDSVETMIQMVMRNRKLPIYTLSTIAVSGKYTPTAWTSLTNKADSILIRPNSIEQQITLLPEDLYFLDLRSLPITHPLQQPQPMIPYLHRTTYTAVWPKVYDGLIFIKNMRPLN
jgi:erythromycin esterase